MTPRKNTAAVATYGDHEVITPENKLRKAVSLKPPMPGEEDPVAEPVHNNTRGEHDVWAAPHGGEQDLGGRPSEHRVVRPGDPPDLVEQ